jgi:hypothetical protein
MTLNPWLVLLGLSVLPMAWAFWPRRVPPPGRYFSASKPLFSQVLLLVPDPESEAGLSPEQGTPTAVLAPPPVPYDYSDDAIIGLLRDVALRGSHWVGTRVPCFVTD